MRITGYYAYRIFLTMKAHFNQENFDINKYDFHFLKPPYETFLKTKGIGLYDILAKKVKSEKQLVNILICAFIRDPTTWIKDIVENYSDYKKRSDKWEGKMNNFPYLFEQDCYKLMERGLKFDSSLGEFVLDEFCNGNINVETFIIFKKIFVFSLDKSLNFEYIYKHKYSKYELLLKFDLTKYKEILEGVVRCNRMESAKSV